MLSEGSGMNIDICVCTFRRVHIADTLRSVARIDRQSGWNIHVIVADNDEEPSAQDLVEFTAKETGLSLTYIHAPACNISIARNACLDASTAPFMAFIDDDELVTEGWLESLVSKMESSGADVVLGQVRAIYGPDTPDWVRQGDFHSNEPVRTGGKIVTGASNNVLIRKSSPSVNGKRFRKDFGKTGGEDTVYFSEIYKAGGLIEYAPQAIVTEIVPPNRASFIWLLKRRFRFGQTHARLLLNGPGNAIVIRAKNILIADAKGGFCLAMALLNIFRLPRMIFWVLRGALHVGVIFHLLGKKELELYGERN
jgi:succinoglycan biosynthesis protein ExoM